MNRTRTTPIRLIIVALVGILLLVALIGPPGGGAGSSARQAAVARDPRPHPTSHLSLPPGIDLLNPRPHPKSHIQSTVTATAISQP